MTQTVHDSQRTTATDDGEGRVELKIEGMHCAGCVSRVEGALSAVEGVRKASVSLVNASATIDGDHLSADRLIKAVEDTGFDASAKAPIRESVAEQRTELEDRQHAAARNWRNRVIAGCAAWVPLAALHWGGMAADLDMHSISAPWVWIQTVLAAFVLIFVGSAFYRSAWKAAMKKSTNMDTLIAIGATAAFALSFYVVLLDVLHAAGVTELQHAFPLYFTEAAGLLTLISLGHYLEARTTAAAGSAVRELLALQPDEVVRLASADDSEGTQVQSADIEPGDFMLVRPGERIAVDGVIEHGSTSIDESVVTGESMPVDREPGQDVIAGSMNLTGRIVVRATTSGRDTTVARIADMVRDAQSSKADIQRLADKVCSIFVPAVITIAIVTFIGWAIFGGDSRWVSAIVNATTVLVISCPCALGLATPTAVMVGSGAASKKGILVKSAQTLEHVASLRTLLFDKTGTLTTGKPSVVEVITHADEIDEDDVLRLASSLAKTSTHPLSKAVLKEADKRNIEISEADGTSEQAGQGITGELDGRRVELISRKAAESKYDIGSPTGPEDCTASVVVIDGRVVGEILFRDELRPEAKELMDGLSRFRIHSALVTGDRQTVAKAVAQRIGIEPQHVHADLKPDEKVQAVRREAEALKNGRSSGQRIGMIGDGINDAAALAEAGAHGGVGIAMGAGSNIAIESADVVITGDRLTSILELVHVSRESLKTIKQNLFLSFIYNTLAIPAAALGVLGLHGPLIAAAAMGVSDLCVIGNSLRLKWRLGRESASSQQAG